MYGETYRGVQMYGAYRSIEAYKCTGEYTKVQGIQTYGVCTWGIQMYGDIQGVNRC